MTGGDIAQAAADLVGTRFRLHGRDPATGLDCIGLFAAAMAHCGRPVVLPTGYSLRLNNIDAWLPDPAEFGFVNVSDLFQPGDVVMLSLGAAQFHLAIAAPQAGWIHAHAGLRRVVHAPQRPVGRIVHHWRRASRT